MHTADSKTTLELPLNGEFFFKLLVVWQCTTNQTRAFATGFHLKSTLYYITLIQIHCHIQQFFFSKINMNLIKINSTLQWRSSLLISEWFNSTHFHIMLIIIPFSKNSMRKLPVFILPAELFRMLKKYILLVCLFVLFRTVTSILCTYFVSSILNVTVLLQCTVLKFS